jgi:hypothetical protein
VSSLPPAVCSYLTEHYKGAIITEAGKVTDANGNIRYEAEVRHKDLVFDENGTLIKAEN